MEGKDDAGGVSGGDWLRKRVVADDYRKKHKVSREGARQEEGRVALGGWPRSHGKVATPDFLDEPRGSQQECGEANGKQQYRRGTRVASGIKRMPSWIFGERLVNPLADCLNQLGRDVDDCRERKDADGKNPLHNRENSIPGCEDEILQSGWLLLILPGLIWGASFLFIAEAMRSIGPGGVAFARIAIGFVTLALFPSARKPVGREDWGSVALLGFLWFAFPLSLFPFAEQRVTSALTGMLNGANPLFATLVAAYLARKMPSRGVVIGLAVGLAGTVLMALPAMNEGQSSAIGVAMILVALVCYGIALSIARRLQQKYGGIPVIWRAQGVALLLTAPLGVPDVLTAHWTLGPLLSLLALGAFGTAIANVLMAASAGRFGAARASGTTFLIPVVALALGVAVRDERVAALAVVGGLVCLLGAWLMKRDQQG